MLSLVLLVAMLSPPSLLLCSVNHRLSHLEDDICDLTLDGDK